MSTHIRRSRSRSKHSSSHRRHRSRERSHYRRHSSRSRSHSYSRSHSKYRHNHGRHSRTSSTVSNRDGIEEAKYRAEKLKQIEELKRSKEQEEALRADLTVLVGNLSLRATEREIYELFSDGAGKIRDIQLVRDQRTGRPKGVAYVEFYTNDSVIKALSMSGHFLLNQPIKVTASQAEKNRAAKATKDVQPADSDLPLRLYVAGLTDSLSDITESELRELFIPFGEISSVELQRDSYTGKTKGIAFIEYKKAFEAREAIAAMDGFEISGKKIKVGSSSDNRSGSYMPLNGSDSIQNQTNDLDRLEKEKMQEYDDDLMPGAVSKIELMKRLNRDGDLPNYNSLRSSTDPTRPSSRSSTEIPTENIVLSNMFDSKDPQIKEDSEFFNDLMDDVRSECKKYGNVLQIYINKLVTDGTIWVKFATVDQANAAFQGLNDRLFGGNSITASFVSNSTWLNTCKSAR